jgi:hypothetical protein
MIKLIRFDRKYYEQSRSILGVLYHDVGSAGSWSGDRTEPFNPGERADWGFFKCWVESGNTVCVRSPTPDEIALMDQRLEALKAKFWDLPSDEFGGQQCVVISIDDVLGLVDRASTM